MNRFLFCSVCVFMFALLLPNVFVRERALSLDVLSLEKVKGGITCYHANSKSCPYIEKADCGRVPCNFYNDGRWYCGTPNGSGGISAPLLLTSHSNSYTDYVEDQEPGYKTKSAKPAYCKGTLVCSLGCHWVEERFSYYCVNGAVFPQSPAIPSYSFSGNCYDE